LPEVAIGLEGVLLAKYGTPELTADMLDLILKYDAILMANQGGVAYGSNSKETFFRMEVVEHYARITLVAELGSGVKVLPTEEVSKLFESRARYRVHPNASIGPCAPLVAEDLRNEKGR
jgi:L-fuculose-phosphate aldolase